MSLDCPFLIAPSVFSNIYLQCLWIVHSRLPLQLSLTFIYSVSGLSILDCPFIFSNVYLQCNQESIRDTVFTVSLDCPFLIAPSVISNVYLQCLWIVHSWLPLQFSLTFIYNVWIVHSRLPLQLSLTFIYSVSGLSILDCPFSLWIVS